MLRFLTRLGVVGVGITLASLVGSASGQGLPSPRDQTVCIRHDGSTYRPQCKASRASTICDCGADDHVIEPLCGEGEVPAESDVDANKARYFAAVAGHLDTARYRGHRFCAPDRSKWHQPMDAESWPTPPLPY
jgi:hypothetical protein